MVRMTKICFVHVVMMPLTLLTLLVAAGCGGSTNHAITQAQAQAAAGALSSATTAGLGGSFSASASPSGDARRSLSTVMEDIGAAQAATQTGCTQTSGGETCSFPISSNDSQPCTDGGTIAVSGSISGTVNNNGSGSLNAQVTLIPQNCAVSGVIISGAPSVIGTGQITLVQSAPVLPIALSEVGNISFGQGACPVNLTYTVSDINSCTVSGTACGYPITGTC
jgi:hypothetical protein